MKVVPEMREAEILRRFGGAEWTWRHHRDGTMTVHNRKTEKQVLIEKIKYMGEDK